MPERRNEIRLAIPECVVLGALGPARILDISSSGVGVEVPTRCVFARGESHRLVLSNLSQSVEIEGQVRWTQSGWRDSVGEQGNEYFQTAGIAISKLLTSRPKGIWSSLLEGVPGPVETVAVPEPRDAKKARMTSAPKKRKVKKAREVSASKPAPVKKARKAASPRQQKEKNVRRASPLMLLEPVDGSTITGKSTQVVFSIDRPQTIAGVRINGTEALLRDELGMAEIELRKGTNRIVSMVSRRDGTYSSYVLGTIDRSRTH